jgi:hypothetical protein
MKDMKRSVGGTSAGTSGERGGPDTSTRDPKERLRKENDGIVLSPQRRSFHMGCQMPSAPSTGNPPIGKLCFYWLIHTYKHIGLYMLD